MGNYIGAKAFPTSSGLEPLASTTASNAASIEFLIPSGYHLYEWHFYNMNPVTDAAKFMWRTSVDAGSSYGVATTSVFVQNYHSEAGGNETLVDSDGDSHGNATGDLYMSEGIGNDNDQGGSGRLFLFGAGSPTFVKHFYAHLQHVSAGDTGNISRTAGYVNSTSDVDAIKFFFDSGNIDDGTIVMYGAT